MPSSTPDVNELRPPTAVIKVITDKKGVDDHTDVARNGGSLGAAKIARCPPDQARSRPRITRHELFTTQLPHAFHGSTSPRTSPPLISRAAHQPPQRRHTPTTGYCMDTPHRCLLPLLRDLRQPVWNQQQRFPPSYSLFSSARAHTLMVGVLAQSMLPPFQPKY